MAGLKVANQNILTSQSKIGGALPHPSSLPKTASEYFISYRYSNTERNYVIQDVFYLRAGIYQTCFGKVRAPMVVSIGPAGMAARELKKAKDAQSVVEDGLGLMLSQMAFEVATIARHVPDHKFEAVLRKFESLYNECKRLERAN